MNKDEAILRTKYSRCDGTVICGQRNKYDYFSTPSYVVRALLETIKFEGRILDPCCGKGEISKLLKREGYKVKEIDIEAHKFGVGKKQDFLSYYRKVSNIVANPPFNIALEFIKHALDLAYKKVCIVTRLAFLETNLRHRELFMLYPPTSIMLFSRRIDFRPNGNLFGGGLASIWIIWDKEIRSKYTKFYWYNKKEVSRNGES